VCTAHNAGKGHARQKMVASLQGPTLPYASMTDTRPFQLRATLRGAPSTITITSCPCPIKRGEIVTSHRQESTPTAILSFHQLSNNSSQRVPRRPEDHKSDQMPARWLPGPRTFATSSDRMIGMHSICEPSSPIIPGGRGIFAGDISAHAFSFIGTWWHAHGGVGPGKVRCRLRTYDGWARLRTHGRSAETNRAWVLRSGQMAPLHARGYFRKAKLSDDWRIIEPADELSPITPPGFAPGPVPPRSIVFSPLCFSR